jgi:KUP system potassium uptake protein
VYGDIGTSPLYALRESVLAAGDATSRHDAVYGVLSLILWTLILIVTLKYVFILLRADNNGEGGTLTLMALAQRVAHGYGPTVALLGVIGASLFYGDALITPAISVLSAVEGLKVVTPSFDHYVVALTVIILLALFFVQLRGTARVASFFGPVTAIWFFAIGGTGLVYIAHDPTILLAVNPAYGIEFLLHSGMASLYTLGAVFLAVTGAEALYADLGHFGRRPIQIAWMVLVLPALVFNYLGQGVLLLQVPEAIENPFFLMYADWAKLPMVLLATAATVIASQAVISGAYSLTRQAIQLGLLPRFEIRHTSEAQEGQIYLPRVNAVMLLGVLLLVILFKTSSSLAAAYGIAVTGTMVVTAIMAFVVVWKVWRWPLWGAILLITPFVAIDLTFLGANLLKIAEGGWVPLAIGGCLMLVMYTWRRGSRLLSEKTRRMEVPLDAFVASLERREPNRVPGTAVFLTGEPHSTPTALLHSLKHYKVLHQENVILSVHTAPTPRVPVEQRLQMERIGESFLMVVLNFGYSETPNVPRALAMARKHGWQFDIMSTSFFLSRRALKPAAHSGMPRWQDRLFIALAKSASDATNFFHIPTGRVVEVGTQVTI